MTPDLQNKLEAFFMALGTPALSDKDVAWQGISLLLDKFTEDKDMKFVQTAFARLKKLYTNPPTTT